MKPGRPFQKKWPLTDLLRNAGLHDLEKQVLDQYPFRQDILISSFTADSRQVIKGSLFVGIYGASSEGEHYLRDAISKGAGVIILSKDISLLQNPDNFCDAVVLECASPRLAFSRLAGAFFDFEQPGTVAAVTGTNGKTSVVHFMRRIWDFAGVKSASMGTLGIIREDVSQDTKITTPHPLVLHQNLSDLKRNGITHLAMEASSHALDQHRMDSVQLKAAGITNLARDHIDYHGTFEAYKKAKLRLFEDVLPLGPDFTAVLNKGFEGYEAFTDVARKRKNRIVTIGKTQSDFFISEIRNEEQGQRVFAEIFGRPYEFLCPVFGGFQIENIMMALALCASCDLHIHLDDFIGALEKITSPPGRLQRIEVMDHPNRTKIFIDFAHTEDALLRVLTELRGHTPGRLICVFGCGGDRDRTKRPAMGRIANKYADLTIVTDDNPRTEDPAAIRAEILRAVPDAHDIPDRKEAIAKALGLAKNGYTVVIAGKGHETGQIVGDTVLPFSDEETIKAIMASV